MNIIAVDDEIDALWHIEQNIRAAQPDCRLDTFTSPRSALEFAAEHPIDVAFVDIQMRGMTGLELAMKLKGIHPRSNIVFVTAYSDYMGHALKLHVSGYIIKPSTVADVRCELDNLRFPPTRPTLPLYAQCFGAFEILKDGVPLRFPRAKCKELLAYLIHRRGASVATGELLAVLYEDVPVTDSLKSQLRRIIADLSATLRECGGADWLLKGRSAYAAAVDKIPCDYYAFLNGDVSALNRYTGEYMSQYSWADETNAWMIAHRGAVE